MTTAADVIMKIQIDITDWESKFKALTDGLDVILGEFRTLAESLEGLEDEAAEADHG